MLWTIGAIFLVFFFTFFSCMANVYVLTSLLPFKELDRASNYGFSFVCALAFSLFLLFSDKAVLDKEAVQIYGGITAIGMAALFMTRQIKKLKVPWLLILICFLVAGTMGIFLGNLSFSVIEYMFERGWPF